jgi:release factor glutamine methyltransferase
VPDTSHSHSSSREALGEGPRLLADAVAQLVSAGVQNPRLDAETMLAAACHCSRAAVICGLARIDDAAHERFAAMVARRKQREPLAYILGHKEFYSLQFDVTPAVLIPRPETETVVSTSLEFVQRHPNLLLCDLGTGSGAAGLAIAANAPGVRVTATDISDAALAVAAHNAARLGLAERVQFRRADCFAPLDKLGPLGRFELIISNPPYIAADEFARLAPEISRYEPRMALAGGHDGLEVYRRMAASLTDHLNQNGAAIVEVGAAQSEAVTEIMRGAGAGSIRMICDLAGLPRIVVARFC